MFRFLLLYIVLTGCVTKSENSSALKIYNGKRAKAGEFNYVLDIGTCTGSPIGPRLILTAAHCGNTLKLSGFKYKNIWHKWTCYKHPRYNAKTTLNDYALCVMKRKLPASLPWVSVDVRRPIGIGSKVVLAGYGRPHSGTLYHGITVVEKYRGQDVILDRAVHLGSGDSGGSAFREGTTDIIGVQSRTFVKSKRSILNRTYDPEFRFFLADIALKHRLIVCGFTRRCK